MIYIQRSCKVKSSVSYTRLKGTEVRLALNEGLGLEMTKLCLNNGSKDDEEQVDRMEKLSREIG